MKRYAQRFVSDNSDGGHNGLYWQGAVDEFDSPLDPLIAAAGADPSGGENYGGSMPFYGYNFRILTSQGKNAKGGAMSYLVNGKMTRGFAFLAYPARIWLLRSNDVPRRPGRNHLPERSRPEYRTSGRRHRAVRSRFDLETSCRQVAEKERNPMNVQSTLATSFGLMLLVANAAFAQDVKTDYDRSAHFGQYKTYSWEQVKTADPLWVDRIKTAVNRELAAKGWTLVQAGGDAAIMAIETSKTQQTLNTFYDGLGGGWRWGGFGEATTTTDTYKVGTLVVDVFDANTKHLIWRGSASETLSDKSDKNIKNLDKAAEKLFAHFPPKPSKSE